MYIVTLIMIGLSLSIDAFSLSLAYGLLKVSKKTIILISVMVGLFHFFMPLLGNAVGSLIIDLINFKAKYILVLVLIIVLIEMVRSLKEERAEYNLNPVNIILFALMVSLDSFSLGIGISYITDNILLASSIFSIISFSFTLSGFLLGKYLSIRAEKYAKGFGITILFTVILYFLCKH